MTETRREEWMDRARATRLEAEATKRGIKLRKGGRNELVGACPRCGGDDRFSINTKDQLFNCRGCNGKGRGAIDFVMFLDESNFMSATEKLAGPAPKTLNVTVPSLTGPAGLVTVALSVMD